jgi:hypothetical protein
MGAFRQDEIAASVAAHRDLGPGYDEAVAAGLVERIGDEIDRRIDARLGLRDSQVPVPTPAPPPPLAPPAPPRPRRSGVAFLGFVSMTAGVSGTAVALNLPGDHTSARAGQIILAMFIWAAITVINVAYARHR